MRFRILLRETHPAVPAPLHGRGLRGRVFLFPSSGGVAAGRGGFCGVSIVKCSGSVEWVEQKAGAHEHVSMCGLTPRLRKRVVFVRDIAVTHAC